MYGYNGKILRINLSLGEVTVESVDEKFYRELIGGSCLVSYYLLKEVPAGVDAFSDENVIVIATSAYTGTSMPGGNRISMGCKSPLTGGIANSEAGGFWGPELKFAGYDAIVIKGRSKKPCYLWINDGKVEIRDGSGVWGKTTGDAEDIIREEVSEPKCKILQTGIAGENLVRFAAVTNGLTHWCGRGGIGAVMGSKNLRAVAVRGTKKVNVHEPSKMIGFAKWFNETQKQDDFMQFKTKYGTLGAVGFLDNLGLLPTSNFRKGSFEGAESISGQDLHEKYLKGTESCYACPLKCKRIAGYKDENMEIEERYGGPEFESAGSLGSNCEVGSQLHSLKANELCSKYGMDTISMGATIAFAMECFEKGLISEKDTDGIDLSFGNGDAVLEIIEKTAKREGIGDLLAEGSWRAAQEIGNGAEEFAMTAKKQEFPAHDPRGKWGVGLGYAVAPQGADHLIVAHDQCFVSEPDKESTITGMDIYPMRYFGIFDPMPAASLGPEKVRLFVHLQYLWSLYDVLAQCKFLGVPEYRMISIEQLVDALNHITGWDVSVWEAVKVGEKAIQLARMFNYKHGLGASDDALPERMYQPIENGAHEGFSINKEDLEKALCTYYEMMGWDKSGKPTFGKFAELGLEELYFT